MKKLSLLLLATLSLLSAGLSWESSYDKAVTKSRQAHKGIMVFVEANHCPYCEQMQEEVLDQKYMPNALKHFVPLKLDINSPDAKKHFPQAYVTPSIYFVTADKQPLDEAIGFTPEEFFLWKIDSAEKEARKQGIFK